jgi:hypothetical protein
MWYIAIILLLAWVVYLLKHSKNSFFQQDRSVLSKKRLLLINVLNDFNFPENRINFFMDAFYYFEKNPTKFDGSTIIKDLYTINNLDSPAMVHDYGYIMIRHLSFFKWLPKKMKLDINYYNDMRMLGIPFTLATFRLILLLLSTPLYPLFKKLNK